MQVRGEEREKEGEEREKERILKEAKDSFASFSML